MKHLLVCALAALMAVGSLPQRTYAMLAPTDIQLSDSAASVSATANRDADVRTIQKALESKIMRERLRELGYSDKEIQNRMNRLSDADLHQLAVHIHALNPAGDISVFGILAVVVLVLLIVYLFKRI